MSAAPIQLAVVGHTNTGKTSLLRTLTRDASLGEVSDRPATTREVARVDLLAEGVAVISLYDTPGLEDPIGLMQCLEADRSVHADPVARIESFLLGDHGGGDYEQEAKVLRQLRRSDVALVVIDAREQVLARHREELRLFAQCGRPLLPVLNFVAGADARTAEWREALGRMGLHVLAEFDTVVYEPAAEEKLFDKLALLIEPRAADVARLVDSHRRARNAQLGAACRSIALLLVDVAAFEQRSDASTDAALDAARLREAVRRAEQACVDDLLRLFRFDLHAYAAPQLPLDQGRWSLDPFDPEALRVLGIRTGSAIAAGAVAGVSVDAMLGGASLGAGAVIGATAGTVWSAYQSWGRRWVDGLRGFRVMAAEEVTLAVLAARQIALLRALLRRGHAATAPLQAGIVSGWPDAGLRAALLRARAHPGWSRLGGGEAPREALEAIATCVAQAVHRA
jgi:hypothetical protein